METMDLINTQLNHRTSVAHLMHNYGDFYGPAEEEGYKDVYDKVSTLKKFTA